MNVAMAGATMTLVCKMKNFVLKAKELGLDTLIMGIRDGEAIRNFLDVPGK